MALTLKKVEIEIPEAMEPFVIKNGGDFAIRRNAMLMYPYILNKTISHGRAAEILGMKKLDLIDLYETMGFSYLDQTMDELEDDLATLRKIRKNEALA